MSDLSFITRSRAEQVYDRLHELILRPGMEPGTRLQPLRTLARRFGTSVPTVQRAMDQLAEEGLLIRRQGSGTFVAKPEQSLDLDRPVALCIEVGADVFGDLANQLLGYLHEHNYPVTLFDTSHSRAPGLLNQLAQTKASCLVIHGHSHLLDAIQTVDLRKPIVPVLDWETTRDFGQVSPVLCDYRAGVEMVTDHLWGLGHRRLLIVGTGTQIWSVENPGRATSSLPVHSAPSWWRRGGTARLLASHESAAGTLFEPVEFLRHFEGPDAATAIFALRDIEASVAQRLLRRHRPELAGQVAIVGYYDTPWSLSADPPITSVNLNLAEVARLAAERIVAIQTGGRPSTTPVQVAPRLVVRGTSVACANQSTWNAGP